MFEKVKKSLFFSTILFLAINLNIFGADNNRPKNDVKIIEIDKKNLFSEGWINNKVYVAHIDSFPNGFADMYGSSSEELIRGDSKENNEIIRDFFCPNSITRDVLKKGGILMVINREYEVNSKISIMIVDNCDGYKNPKMNNK